MGGFLNSWDVCRYLGYCIGYFVVVLVLLGVVVVWYVFVVNLGVVWWVVLVYIVVCLWEGFGRWGLGSFLSVLEGWILSVVYSSVGVE